MEKNKSPENDVKKMRKVKHLKRRKREGMAGGKISRKTDKHFDGHTTGYTKRQREKVCADRREV